VRRRPERGAAGRAVLLCLLCLLLLPAVAAPAAAQGEALSAAAFVQRLEDARALAAEAEAAPSPARMEEVRSRLGLPVEVRLPDGRQVAVARDPVLDALEGTEAADFGAAAAHVSALSASVGRALAAPPLEPGAIEEALERAYRGVRTEPSWPERVELWVQERIDRIVEWIRARIEADPRAWEVVQWVVLGLGAVVVVAVTLRVARQVGLVPAGDRTLTGEPVQPVDWARAAEEALARGEAREAVRALYRLVVEILTERELVPNLPSLTPAECRTAVRRQAARVPGGNPGLMAAVDRATAAFEHVVYGRMPATPADVEALRAAERAARAA
jgi:hypothetical protein